MKKYIVTTISLLVFITFLNSCSEDFLKEKPEDRYVVGNFYSSQSDAEAAVSAVYQQLYGIYERLMFLLNELPADDEKNGLGMPNQYLQNLEFCRHNSENQFARQMWERCYQGVSKANTAIDNIPGVTMDERIKSRLIGEAKFLRALYYFNLVRFYGDVPVVLKIEGVDDAMIARTPKEEVYAQIIQDLTDAENDLPPTYTAANSGRATQGAAKILLGKVYLTKHDYQKSVDKLAEVVNNESTYGYGLHEYFGNNWEKETENGVEMVFSVEFMDPPGNGNNAMQLQGPKYSLPSGFGPLGLSNSNEADIPTMELYNLFTDDDERKAETFRTEFVSLVDESVHVSSIPIFVKYWEEGEKVAANSDANMHVFRYADALLMYAEALNEIGQTDEAMNHLNRIRERAFNTSDKNYSGLTKEEFRNAVWQERRMELTQEGHRWFDLARTGRYIERMKEHAAYEASVAESNKTDIISNISERHVLMPVPQREIDLNPLLNQNPGY